MTASPHRWPELAWQIADGVEVGRGSRVAISMAGAPAQSAVWALVEEVYRRGGLPQVILSDEHFERMALRNATYEILTTPSPVELALIDWADAYVSFRPMLPPAGMNCNEPDDADAAHRTAAMRKAKGAVSNARWRQTTWAIVRVPTPEWAQFAGIEYLDLETEFFDGCLSDWATTRPAWQDLAELLETKKNVFVQGDGTNLRMSVAGRKWVVFAGQNNFPDGELATAPIEDSAVGHITFPGRFAFANTIFEDLELDFRDGAVVEVSASQGQRVAEALIASDKGACRIGELGIGLNLGMTTLTGDLFFDEKIPGTVHVALGRSYPECGGQNLSSLHWDIVKDLRPGAGRTGGSLSCDDAVLIDSGRTTELITIR